MKRLVKLDGPKIPTWLDYKEIVGNISHIIGAGKMKQSGASEISYQIM